MAKIFEISFETGSLIDKVSKTAGTPAGGWKFARTEKGLVWHNDGSAYLKTWNLGDRPSNGTIVIWFRQDKVVNLKYPNLLFTDDLNINNGIRFEASYNLGALKIYVGDADSQVNDNVIPLGDYCLNKWFFIITTWEDLNINAYWGSDNNSITHSIVDLDITGNAPTTFPDLVIGRGYDGTRYWYGDIAKVGFYNHIFTAQERTDAYEEFLKASPRGIELYPKPVLPERKPTDLSRYADTGLCLAYNMIPSAGNLLVDTSNQNAPGVIDGATETLEGLSFDGKDDSAAINLSLALAATVKTICFRIKFASTTEMILDGDATGSLIIDTNTGTLQYPAYDNAFINGVDTDTIFADQWTDVVITSSTAVDNNTPTLGRTTAAAFTYGKFEIADLQYWSVEFTLQDAKDYHNSFVKPVLGRIPSVYDTVGSTWPFGMVQGTGSYIVDELTAQDAVLKELDIGTKFKRVTGAGTISVPTKQAYGTWEGFIYKGDTANRLYMILIANKIGVAGYVQGYALNFDNDEGIYLEKYDGVGGTTVLFATAASYITINTWYKYRFTRTLDGVMTLLLKGGALVPTAGYDGWTLAAPTGAYVNPTAADNTYTTCEYSVIDGGVLDRVILDHTDNGVKQ